MRFTLHELKLWFDTTTPETKTYTFLPNKINVITGDATTGKSSFWSIIDYCLLNNKINIPNTIFEKVRWFGIRFTINDKEVSIIRKTPEKGVASTEVIFNRGAFLEPLTGNTSIGEIKAFLDNEFGITDSLRFPHGKASGGVSVYISYRHFLLFNALTENIIGSQETYFDTTFFGKDEYEKALNHIFDMVIGINDMDHVKTIERLHEIGKELQKIESQEKNNQKKIKNYKDDISLLIDKCKQNNLIEYDYFFETVEEAIADIETVIGNTQKKAVDNPKLFAEVNALTKERNGIQGQYNAITQYQKEYEQYRRNLNKSADSLQPITYLNEYLSEQLVDSYETQLFLGSLEASLSQIRSTLSKKVTEPVKVNGDINELKKQLKRIDDRIGELRAIQSSNLSEAQKFMVVGEIKNAYEQLLKSEVPKPVDTVKWNRLVDEKGQLEKLPEETAEIKKNMQGLLNESIERNFNQLTSIPDYKNSALDFITDKKILQLRPPGHLFFLENVGSKSNYMFMHLCLFLGLHEHMINIEQKHVPQFLFIDQPSIPYYTGDNKKGNDDEKKLLDAFTLLNSFINYIIKIKKESFQIFMVEHASKELWITNNLNYFHTVDEFIDGKGLIPDDIYNN
ncbi:hypothetical protein BAY13_17095 [Elizabethkingia bruuniana]|uniref:DUF3732 domain-containing protein n=1 Tax=Elizabethkingia bruuniana TaxID=1756149 RepID=UPI00099916E6|nr:DUF3732 domain-containing protein [Elizabethkingia bruuniana]OPC66452.1 hypothetical protein BAY13_17095 [Elizabethkingia bruuniana]